MEQKTFVFGLIGNQIQIMEIAIRHLVASKIQITKCRGSNHLLTNIIDNSYQKSIGLINLYFEKLNKSTKKKNSQELR